MKTMYKMVGGKRVLMSEHERISIEQAWAKSKQEKEEKLREEEETDGALNQLQQEAQLDEQQRKELLSNLAFAKVMKIVDTRLRQLEKSNQELENRLTLLVQLHGDEHKQYVDKRNKQLASAVAQTGISTLQRIDQLEQQIVILSRPNWFIRAFQKIKRIVGWHS